MLHRINGFKMLRLLIRSGERVDAVDNLDEAFQNAGAGRTNIIAGLTLDDGQTIAAWLPEAEVDAEATLPWPGVPGAATPFVSGVPGSPGSIDPTTKFDRPDITIIGRDGMRREARYVGLDGTTGLSLLRLPEKGFPLAPEVKELELFVGQRMRLFSPEPVQETGTMMSDAVYVRIGETEGQVANVDRGASGAINRIRIRSGKLSPSNIGGVAVTYAGQTIGIIESIAGTEASVLPAAVIRAAARRVLARQTSVPRPWLGVSGEPVAFTSLDQIVRQGWKAQRARSLIENQRGILLTSVSPGSPAAVAALHPGDVIVSVNDSEVKSTADFSLLLADAGDAPIRFNVVRPRASAAELILIKLAKSPEPFSAFKFFSSNAGRRPPPNNPLIQQGIETVLLRAPLSTRAGTLGRLLVVHVQPTSAAAKSGLRSGDVIEAIDGRPILPLAAVVKIPRYTLNVLRNKERLVITVIAPRR